MSNSSIRPIVRTLLVTTILGQSGPGSERVLRISQSTIRLFNIINRTLTGKGFYPSAEMQSDNSTAPADRAVQNWNLSIRRSLASYPGHLLWGGGSYPQHFLAPTNKASLDMPYLFKMINCKSYLKLFNCYKKRLTCLKTNPQIKLLWGRHFPSKKG